MPSQLADVRDFYQWVFVLVGEVEKSNTVVTVGATQSELQHGVALSNDESGCKVTTAAVENYPEVSIEYAAKKNCRERIVGASEISHDLPERGFAHYLYAFESSTGNES